MNARAQTTHPPFHCAAHSNARVQTRTHARRHSLHAISSQLAPAPGCGGIELLSADAFDLHCFSAPTGTKFLLRVEARCPRVPELLAKVYELYADYVLKNPFYEAEQVRKGGGGCCWLVLLLLLLACCCS